MILLLPSQLSKMGDFTIPGYNDIIKPCPHCKGKVHPTWEANSGKCDTCKKRILWNNYDK